MVRSNALSIFSSLSLLCILHILVALSLSASVVARADEPASGCRPIQTTLCLHVGPQDAESTFKLLKDFSLFAFTFPDNPVPPSTLSVVVRPTFGGCGFFTRGIIRGYRARFERDPDFRGHERELADPTLIRCGACAKGSDARVGRIRTTCGESRTLVYDGAFDSDVDFEKYRKTLERIR